MTTPVVLPLGFKGLTMAMLSRMAMPVPRYPVRCHSFSVQELAVDSSHLTVDNEIDSDAEKKKCQLTRCFANGCYARFV